MMRRRHVLRSPACMPPCLPHLPAHAPPCPPISRTQGTALPELQRGLASLRRQLGEHTGALKALVKENFDRFISRLGRAGAGGRLVGGCALRHLPAPLQPTGCTAFQSF